jgi:hypothetical protein
MVQFGSELDRPVRGLDASIPAGLDPTRFDGI